MALRPALKRYTDWFFEGALPFWASRAADPEGGFYESLDFDSAPVPFEDRRVRVLARQIHVFATVGRLGRLEGAGGIAARGFDYFVARCCPDEGLRGSVHRISADGRVIDARRDLYDQAFLLLASASVHRLVQDPRASRLAARALAFLEGELKAAGGGYLEDDRHSRPRRQNPHMHLFEAFMALDAAGLAMGAARADIFSLFETRFLDRQAGILREFFTDDLAAHDPAKGDLVEPGHMMEWVWLLDRRRRQTGVAAFDIQTLLYRRAIELGEDPAGFLVDQIRLGDRPHGSRRLWPQTEYLKAALVMARQGDKDASSRAERLIDALFQSYLDQNVKGLWCDRYDGSGRPAAQSVPASILYHLMEAALEAERHLREAQ